jgi:hypothetical protein
MERDLTPGIFFHLVGGVGKYLSGSFDGIAAASQEAENLFFTIYNGLDYDQIL